MTEIDPEDEPADWEADDAYAPVRGWLKPLLWFAIALACGLLASMLWMRAHPRPILRTLPSEAAVPLDPNHRALPAPMAGGTTTLPLPAAQGPDAPHIVSPEPDVAVPEESAGVDVATNGAETNQAAEVSPDSDETASAPEIGPQVSDHTAPSYPSEALRAGVEGTALLTLSIDAQGNVVDVRVARSSGSIALDRAAIDNVRGWHYRPATRDGQPVSSTIDVPINFKLAGPP